MDKKYIVAIICVVAIVAVGLVVAMGGGDKTSTSSDEKGINVSDVSVSEGSYGTYDINANVVPDKDYSYLELVAIYYDNDGAVIYKDSLSWNINDAKEGQKYKIDGTSYISGKGTPVKVELGLFDSAFSGGSMDDAIWKKTIEL